MHKTDDLFRSAASYYAEYRPFYPRALIRDIVRTFGLKKDHAVLDIGSGTGQLAIQLAKFARKIVAIEPSAAMIAEGRKFARKHHVRNIRWIKSRAEDIGARNNLGTFYLATFGTSLHWINQDKVFRALDPLIKEGGGVVITGSATLWTKAAPWEKAVKELIQKYLGKKRRAGNGTFRQREESFGDILKRSAFSRIEQRHYRTIRWMSVNQIVGLLFSTSFANPAVFGNKKQAFERELRKMLLHIRPSGKFIKKDEYFAIFARSSRSHEPDHGSVI